MRFNEAIIKWTQNSLNPHFGCYSGRGPKIDDLGPKHLQMIFEGMKEDFGPKSELFLKFVNDLEDLSATAFLIAFEPFYNAQIIGGKNYIKPRQGDSYALSVSGDNVDAQTNEGMSCLMSALTDRRNNEQKQMESDSIKATFLHKHNITPRTKGVAIVYSEESFK